MFSHAMSRILASVSRSTCLLSASGRVPAAADQLLSNWVAAGAWPHLSAPQFAPLLPSLASLFSSKASPQPLPAEPSSAHLQSTTPGADAQAAPGAAAEQPPASSPTSDPASADPGSFEPAAPAGPASRRDKDAPADTIYPSSKDDNLGVQRNWFNALFSQLNVVNRTGMVPHMKGRQREVFCAVEREFEGLWERHVRGKGLQGAAHRGMLLCCLAIATHKVLRYETGDDELVKEVVRTNLGGMAVSIMMRLHKARLWLLLKLLAEDPYKEAVRLLPSLQSDLGSLLESQVAAGDNEATWTIRSCGFHSVLAEEDALELAPEFCCQYSMQWLEGFSEYGVRVGLEKGLAFGDESCQVRISRRLTAASAESKDGSGAEAQQGQRPAQGGQ